MANTGVGRMRTRSIDYLVIILLSAAVSWGVAEWRNTAPASNSDISSAPQVSLTERQTVQLKNETIAPIFSNLALVVPAEDEGRFMLQADIDPAELAYQLVQEPVGVKGSITGGPAGFDCAWAGLGVGMDGRAVMQCLIPEDIVVVQGLGGMMGVQLEAPTTALSLPITAVRGTVDQGEVVVVHMDGSTEVRAVELGAQDSFHVQITSGLEPDEAVLLAPFGSDFRNTSP